MAEIVNTTNMKVETEDDTYTKDGTVDYKNNPANRKTTGTWKACPFILGKPCTFDFLKVKPVSIKLGYIYILTVLLHVTNLLHIILFV